MKIIICNQAILSIFVLSTLLYSRVNAQDVWEIDKDREREKINKTRHDSIMVHLRNRVELSIGFGPFYQSGFYKTEVINTGFGFPDNMNQWQFALAWHPGERFVLDLTLASRIKKEVPTPDIFSVISGDDIEIEGRGSGVIPVMLGMKYYLTTGRLRPYIGISGGVCNFKSQYTEVLGNIYDGINRTDYKQDELLKIVGFETGFTYRLGERINAGIGLQYQQSEPFKEMDIGHNRLGGFTVTPHLSVLLF